MAWSAGKDEHHSPETATLREACLPAGPVRMADFWELGLREGPHQSLLRMAPRASALYGNGAVHAEHLLFFWELGIA